MTFNLDSYVGRPDRQVLRGRVGGFSLPSGVPRAMRLNRRQFRAKSTTWRDWLLEFFPQKVRHDFSDDQMAIWEWAERIKKLSEPEGGKDLAAVPVVTDLRAAVWEGYAEIPPLVAILPRGAGKTTTLDLVSVYLLCMGARNFVLIVSANMGKSKARVKSIQLLLGNPALGRVYPDVCEPAIGPRGVLAGWSDTVLRMESGQVVVATAIGSDNRGFNEGHQRPDFIGLDDLDKKTDGPAMTRRKEDVITTSILPTAGDRPAAVLFIQNLIIPHGIAGRLVTGKAGWAREKILRGPTPAVLELKTERRIENYTTDEGNEVQRTRDVIVSGRATWAGQPIKACQQRIDTWGLSTFMHENQHVVTDNVGALWHSSMIQYQGHKVPTLAEFDRIVVGVDPSGGADVYGIVVAGVIRVPHPSGNGQKQAIYYVLDDLSVEPGSGMDWADTVIRASAKYSRNGRPAEIEAERNYGGDMVTDSLEQAVEKLRKAGEITASPVIGTVWAAQSKANRADPVAKLYRDGVVFHARIFDKLEAEQTTWVPYVSKESPNRLDALVHALSKLRRPAERNRLVPQLAGTDHFY